MTDDIANSTLRLLQEMRAEMATTNARLELLAETYLNLSETSRKQSGQLEILTMAFNRQSQRLERIEDRLDVSRKS